MVDLSKPNTAICPYHRIIFDDYGEMEGWWYSRKMRDYKIEVIRELPIRDCPVCARVKEYQFNHIREMENELKT